MHWTEVEHEDKQALMRFQRDDVRVDIYYTSMVVAVIQGGSQIFRKVDEVSFVEVMSSPSYISEIPKGPQPFITGPGR